MFTPGSTPSATLMSLKFGSPTSQPSTSACSSAVTDGFNFPNLTNPDKPAPSLHRTALYSLTYEEAAANLRQVQCTDLSIGRTSRILPGVEDMLNGVLPPQFLPPTQKPSLSPNEITYSSLHRRPRRNPTSDSRSTISANSHAQSPRQRVSVACTFCRARKLRCTPGPPPCEHCKRRSHPCIFECQSQHRDPNSQNPSSNSTPKDWTSLQC